MELIWWLIAIVLMAVGLLGTILPLVPGAIIILAAAIIHQLMLPEKSLGWWNIAGLVVLTLLSYALEFGSGYFGAKRFGASRWGTFGAVIGTIVGLFFGLPGLLIGPLLGAVAGELIAGKRLVTAGRAGWGTVLGNLAGMVAKLVIAIAMISWFLLTVPSPI
jgi:uncharacterized protein